MGIQVYFCTEVFLILKALILKENVCDEDVCRDERYHVTQECKIVEKLNNTHEQTESNPQG